MNPLKIAHRNVNPMQSFINIHRDCNQATPEKLSLFKHALLLFKLYNTNLPKLDWIALNFQQVNSARQAKFQIVKITVTKLVTTSSLTDFTV